MSEAALTIAHEIFYHGANGTFDQLKQAVTDRCRHTGENTEEALNELCRLLIEQRFTEPLQARNLGELIPILQRIADTIGPEAQCHGWDDGSLYVTSKFTTHQIHINDI